MSRCAAENQNAVLRVLAALIWSTAICLNEFLAAAVQHSHYEGSRLLSHRSQVVLKRIKVLDGSARVVLVA